MWVLIDNYDSFTYILHHYLLSIHGNIEVYKNDAISLAQLIQLHPERLIISPGPETPDKAGITNEAIRYFYTKIPILGICIGHQALGIYEGALLEKAKQPMHGKISRIKFVSPNHVLVAGFKAQTEVMRYHSLVLKNWEKCTNIIPIALSAEDNELMAFTHKNLPIVGYQFHPESVLTTNGMQWLQHWDRFCKLWLLGKSRIK